MAEFLVAGGSGLRLLDGETGACTWQGVLHESPDLDADRRRWLAWYGEGVCDEAKPIPGTTTVLATAVAGLVAIVDLAGGLESIAWEPGAHSAEVLPDGQVVVAVSDSPGAYPADAPRGRPSRLVLHRRGGGGRALHAVDLHDAHGVQWDAAAERVWALGKERLATFRVAGGRLVPESIHPLPREASTPTGGGHDLARDPSTGDLLVTTVTGAWRFARGAFTALPRFAGRHLKSIAVHPRTGAVAWTEADPQQPATARHILVDDGRVITPAHAPYKVRWAERDADGRFLPPPAPSIPPRHPPAI